MLWKSNGPALTLTLAGHMQQITVAFRASESCDMQGQGRGGTFLSLSGYLRAGPEEASWCLLSGRVEWGHKYLIGLAAGTAELSKWPLAWIWKLGGMSHPSFPPSLPPAPLSNELLCPAHMLKPTSQILC